MVEPRAGRPGERRSASALGAEVVIEKLIPEGKALGHLEDGRVVIVAGAVPGDRVLLSEVSETKGLVQGRAFRLLEASAWRQEPRCPVARECGGCDWMMLSVAQQRTSKLGVLEEALQRTGKLDTRAHPPTLVTGPTNDGYRGRVRLQVQEGRVGFYWRGSHQLVEPEHCLVSSPLVNLALSHVRSSLRYSPQALNGFVWLEIREDSVGTVSIHLQRAPGARSQADASWLAALREHFIVVHNGTETAPETWQRYQLTPDTYMLSPPGGFTQVNWAVNQLLIGRFVGAARERGVASFLDAYAGSGNFSLPLLAQGVPGLGIEAHAGAIRAAREAARRQGLREDSFEVGEAGAVARRLGQQGQRFDLVFLDPPRAGVKSGLAELAALAERWLSLCSCNPVTLARDLRALVDLGFGIESIEAFDMFPHTHHLETLVWLRAPGARLAARPA